MRSRYSAYASEAVRYIIDTTHPDGPHHEDDVRRWTQSIEAFCRGTEFVKLEVLDSGDLPDGDAWVTFRANLTQSGQDASFVERSVFRKHQGTWKYLSGEPEPVSP